MAQYLVGWKSDNEDDSWGVFPKVYATAKAAAKAIEENINVNLEGWEEGDPGHEGESPPKPVKVKAPNKGDFSYGTWTYDSEEDGTSYMITETRR